MSVTVSASEVERNFERYHDRALSEPIRVTKDGRETVYIISARVYREMKCAQRDSLASADLTDDELFLIDTAEIPAAHRHE
ncbi:type II toxin-antitoxin system prevent-host-death family antitoxin [Pleomorphomonas sp. JP5]|uniref:type II toxin-antitoxin system prevent-host-death family antitoxin n=1 Tax=Pleomorphomonas sp. JP5 TaxID=2942998 RepID=UPI00204475E1|nr:type II toxin-antitoxin system prevent-host-death family antitoxin [Pleomorphomonas sp. JP5]MCM5557139.1 type II toxin-antitoxin system Phd/YefM family antitoxin [Pleomorphomonas sp. JP5]